MKLIKQFILKLQPCGINTIHPDHVKIIVS